MQKAHLQYQIYIDFTVKHCPSKHGGFRKLKRMNKRWLCEEPPFIPINRRIKSSLTPQSLFIRVNYTAVLVISLYIFIYLGINNGFT